MRNTTVIVPCYNEEKRLNVTTFLANATTISYNILFVNDGSSDGTPDVLKGICKQYPEFYTCLNLKKNGGKAEAIRAGVLHLLEQNPTEFIGFLDADLATSLQSMDDIIDSFEKNPELKASFGIRLKRLGVNVSRSLFRHYLGRVFATITSMLLNLPVYDTQCGAKVFHRDLCQFAFSDSFLSKWFFDIEIIFRLKNKLGREFLINKVYEFPMIQWSEEKGSKLTFYNYLFAPFELFKIYWYYKK